MTNITKLPAAPEKTQKPKLPALTLKNLTDYGLPEQLATPLYEAVTLMRAGRTRSWKP